MGARSSWLRVAPVVVALAWGGNHFSVLLPLYRQAERYTQLDVDLLFAVYIVGIIPGFLIAGPLSDRYGRRRVLLAGAALGVVGSALLAAGAGALPVLAAGRFVSGASVAVAMVVGTTWIRELSVAPFDDAPAPVAARRGALSLTAGFGLGPTVSGVLAQWGPSPTLLPYAVQVVLVVAAAPLLLAAPETRAGELRRPLTSDLGVPAASRRRFLTVLVPAAPWVFGAAGIAFAVTPSLVTAETGDLSIAYATLLAVAALSAGALVQPWAPAIGRATGGRQLVVGLAAATAGILLVAAVASTAEPWLGVVAAALLGAAYGVILVSGLTEVQRTTPPARLAGTTAVYYSVTYVGFAIPVVVAALTPLAPPAVLLLALAVLAAACAVRVAVALRAG